MRVIRDRDRDSTVVVGKHSEDRVVRVLLDRGWRIVGRNLDTQYGEIDILAIRTKKLTIFEVKTVQSFDDLDLSIRSIQRARLERVRAFYESRSMFSVDLVLVIVLGGENESVYPRFYPFPLHNLEVS